MIVAPVTAIVGAGADDATSAIATPTSNTVERTRVTDI
jgi:hypothetical protein